MSILFENCDILLRKAGEYRTLRGFLGVKDERIAYIGEEKPQEAYDETKNISGKLLMPGLVNCHNHAPMVLLRGVGGGLPLQEWLFDKIFPIEDRLISEDIVWGSYLALLEMIAGGTTSFSDMYFFPWETAKAVEKAGIRANLCRVVQCFDENETAKQNKQIPESIRFFEEYNGYANDRVRVDFALHAEYTCKEHIAREYSDVCRSYGGRMHLHLSETQREVRECVQRYGVTPVQWFENCGTFENPTAAAHCVALSLSDREILRSRGVNVIHNPTSNMKLGSGFAPVRELIDMGVNVALGTDGAASNNNLNMFEEMHLASVLHCGYTNDPTIISAAQVLDMATVNGAKLQGRDDVGVLEVGKKADIIALDLDRPHLYPNFDTPALITCSAQAGDIVMTMVDGKILYENGEFKTLDREKIMAESKRTIARLYA